MGDILLIYHIICTNKYCELKTNFMVYIACPCLKFDPDPRLEFMMLQQLLLLVEGGPWGVGHSGSTVMTMILLVPLPVGSWALSPSRLCFFFSLSDHNQNTISGKPLLHPHLESIRLYERKRGSVDQVHGWVVAVSVWLWEAHLWEQQCGSELMNSKGDAIITTLWRNNFYGFPPQPESHIFRRPSPRLRLSPFQTLVPLYPLTLRNLLVIVQFHFPRRQRTYERTNVCGINCGQSFLKILFVCIS